MAKEHNHWWQTVLLKLYESLTRNDPVQPADLIVVMAGMMDRKQYGLDLYRSGVAPVLLLSVGRFEVSRMSSLPLDGFDELKALRDSTPPEARHFFVTVDPAGVHTEIAKLPLLGTYGELLGLRRALENARPRRVIVVSSSFHLRRVALTAGKVFRKMPVEFLYCPVPFAQAVVKKESWWTRPAERSFVVKELMKLAGYRVILSMPPRTADRLMRLYRRSHS